MKKQSGFTLIELMVVMAIIAILATAGLSAYTGYIKKARDTTRIADLAAINTIILGEIGTTGSVPALGTSTTGLGLAIRNANNGQAIQDPLTATDTSCFANDDATSTASDCIYYYQTCDSSTTYRLIARFESASNKALYNVDADTTGATCDPTGDTCVGYSIGSCSSAATGLTALASSIIP